MTELITWGGAAAIAVIIIIGWIFLHYLGKWLSSCVELLYPQRIRGDKE